MCVFESVRMRIMITVLVCVHTCAHVTGFIQTSSDKDKLLSPVSKIACAQILKCQCPSIMYYTLTTSRHSRVSG